jgi:hypothetical protein
VADGAYPLQLVPCLVALIAPTGGLQSELRDLGGDVQDGDGGDDEVLVRLDGCGDVKRV